MLYYFHFSLLRQLSKMDIFFVISTFARVEKDHYVFLNKNIFFWSMLYNFEQFSLLRQLSKIDSMHEEKIKHEMIDDVWNSRRQRRP